MNTGSLINALLLAIVGAIIRSGKASWLIAGYNTMTKEEKEKYNQKGLSRFISNVIFICAFIEVVEARVQYLKHMPAAVVGYILIVALVVGAAIYANTGNRFR